jgi:hypothetical protein
VGEVLFKKMGKAAVQDEKKFPVHIPKKRNRAVFVTEIQEK